MQLLIFSAHLKFYQSLHFYPPLISSHFILLMYCKQSFLFTPRLTGIKCLHYPSWDLFPVPPLMTCLHSLLLALIWNWTLLAPLLILPVSFLPFLWLTSPSFTSLWLLPDSYLPFASNSYQSLFCAFYPFYPFSEPSTLPFTLFWPVPPFSTSLTTPLLHPHCNPPFHGMIFKEIHAHGPFVYRWLSLCTSICKPSACYI